MNAEADEGTGLLPVPISALQHFSYCPRQCALIHLDQVFDDNILTVRGKLAHERVDNAPAETQDGVQVVRGVSLWSERLGLIGKSDVVEFHPDGTVFPVEYKHGRRHQRRHDDLQLCAQALCLEEMLGASVPQGAIYHHSSRRRRIVEFSGELREQVARTTALVRELLAGSELPAALNDKRCSNCSLIAICLPAETRRGWRPYWKSMFQVEEEP